MLMRKLPIIRLEHHHNHQCNRPSTSTSSWEIEEEDEEASSSEGVLDSIMSPTKMYIQDFKNQRINGYQRIAEEYSLTDSTILSVSSSEATASTSASSGYGGEARMSATQQGYYSPFEQPKSVNDYVIAPNAIPEPMICLASTTSAAVNPASSPSRNSLFERIREVFRPRSGSKSSTTSETPSITASEDLGEDWIHINYYEYSEKVGQTFTSSVTEIGITGYCDLSNKAKLNLGSIAKPNRNPTIRNIRESIREGVKFCNRNGDVYIENLSCHPVFVQAPLLAYHMNHHLATVYKIEPSHSLQIFSSRKFDFLIFQASKLGPEAIDALQQICLVRLSFIRGWGANYHAQTVMELPVRVEVLFIGALHELDKLILKAKSNPHHHQACGTIEDLLGPSISMS